MGSNPIRWQLSAIAQSGRATYIKWFGHLDLVDFEDAYSKVTLMSTIRAFSLVVRALAAMLETLVRIQYIAFIACILILLECGEGGKHTCLIHMHSTVRICPLQPFTAQTAKLIFISTTSGTYDKCRAFQRVTRSGDLTSFTPKDLQRRFESCRVDQVA